MSQQIAKRDDLKIGLSLYGSGGVRSTATVIFIDRDLVWLELEACSQPAYRQPFDRKSVEDWAWCLDPAPPEQRRGG